MKVVFRVDASLEIGSGHVTRCLTLARSLRDHGANCLFICREHPGNLLQIIRDQGFDTAALPLLELETSESSLREGGDIAHNTWLAADWGSDAEQSQALLGSGPVDWLIVDHYALDVRWESTMRPFCRKIMVIDDLADRLHDCDLLLDQNLVTDLDQRYDGKVPEICDQLLGPSFVLLQKEYTKMHPKIRLREGSIKKVLVYFGGADSGNLTGLTASAFRKLNRSGVWVDIVVNPQHPNLKSIYEETEGVDNIEVHTWVSTLASLIAQADLAVGAAGVTAWERCCLGLPSVVITVADNQRPIAEELHRRGVIQWFARENELNLEKLMDNLKNLLDQELPLEWSKCCWETVDGWGTERVTSILIPSLQYKLRARLANANDEHLILKWANDPQVRQHAFSPEEISDNAHSEWFHKRLEDYKNCRIYVIENEMGLPVGQVRFDRQQFDWEITYALDASLRGRRLATKFVATAISKLRKDTAAKALFGRVKESNRASCRVFETLGFAKGVPYNGKVRYSFDP
jgi:UDP-2,4-diacetamido-2,4,6-trideoxy-beta-L-altropyranose hydrolase